MDDLYFFDHVLKRIEPLNAAFHGIEEQWCLIGSFDHHRGRPLLWLRGSHVEHDGIDMGNGRSQQTASVRHGRVGGDEIQQAIFLILQGSRTLG
ncbi:hypothetical protein D3C76_1450670 [compost metagenome]